MTSVDLKSHDSIFSKLDTFKKKKKLRMELEELTKESKQAIEITINPWTIEDPKKYHLEEGESRSFIEKSSKDSESVQNLQNKLLSWINNELADERILVKDLQEDLYDGQLLQKLVEKLANIKLDHPEITQSEIGQLQRLRGVLETVNNILNVREKWTAELIHQKDLVATLRLLVAIAQQFKPEMIFQPGIFLTVIIARKLNGKLQYRYEREYITGPMDTVPGGNPLDRISENHMVLQKLLSFLNFHLNRLGLQVNDFAKDLSDGVLLILLMGLIEDYFVPLHAYNPTPTTEAMRLANVKLAFDLIQAAGIVEPPARPEEIVAGDSKAIIRVIYKIYSHCKQLEQEEDDRRYDMANMRGQHEEFVDDPEHQQLQIQTTDIL